MDDAIAQFTSITSADPPRAAQYLRVSDGNLEQAIQLYFESGGVDMGAAMPSTESGTAGASSAHNNAEDPITIDSDDENEGGAAQRQGQTSTSAAPGGHTVEDDAAMARRLQEEMYGAGGDGSGNAVDGEGVRAPIGRQAETLSGPYSGWRDDSQGMDAAIAEQMLARHSRQAQGTAGRPGIFNQAAPPSSSVSIWEDPSTPNSTRRRELARATAGASDTSSKSGMLAELYRPPFELISPLRSWEGVRAEGKENEKWILINIQDPNIFDCQVLNRDIWKDPPIQATVKEHFIFKQYTKDDPQAANYIRFYFQAYESQDAYPHIAIVDPRTGEQVKVWSGMPAPKAPDFLHQLHEFLDRYSLKAFSKNPVARRKADKSRAGKDVGRMSEEEMLAVAMQNSLEGKSEGPKDDDPDLLTRSATLPARDKDGEAIDAQLRNGNGATTTTTTTAQEQPQPQQQQQQHHPAQTSPFHLIPSNNPHVEPPPSQPNTTRIQFRHPSGRVVRRFALSDPVARLYEWLKSEPLAFREGEAADKHEGRPFELIFVGRNLIECVESGMSVEEAGLKNGSVMVEFVE